jgi:MFS family permease
MPGDKSTINTTVYGWWILALTSVLMLGNYYVYDSIGPVAAQLADELGFSDSQIGSLNAVYSLPNIFLVLIGGVVVDRFGASRVALWTTALCLTGTVLTAWRGEFLPMVAGRFLFGMGAETMIVAVSVSLGIWFARGGVAFAFALSLSVARAGSYIADLSPVWAGPVYAKGWQAPLMLAVGFAALSMLAAMAYHWIEKNKTPPAAPSSMQPETEKIRWRDVLRFNTSFWYILTLCVLFYSAIVPYRSTFSIKYFQHAHDMSLETAAVINSNVYLAAIFVTPLFGWIIDRYGHRALIMVLGSLLLPLAFVLATMGAEAAWATTVLLGVSYAVVPAVLWPSVIKLVEAQRLGTAYGLLFMLQNVGLMVCNLIPGWLNDLNSAGADNPAGYGPMITFFIAVSLGGVAFAVALWRRELGPHSYGLELPGAARPGNQ